MNLLIAIFVLAAIYHPNLAHWRPKSVFCPIHPSVKPVSQSWRNCCGKDNKPIQSWQDINYALADRPGESGQVNLTVNGAGQTNAVESTQRFMKAELGKATNPIDSLGAIPWATKIPAVVRNCSKYSRCASRSASRRYHHPKSTVNRWAIIGAFSQDCQILAVINPWNCFKAKIIP